MQTPGGQPPAPWNAPPPYPTAPLPRDGSTSPGRIALIVVASLVGLCLVPLGVMSVLVATGVFKPTTTTALVASPGSAAVPSTAFTSTAVTSTVPSTGPKGIEVADWLSAEGVQLAGAEDNGGEIRDFPIRGEEGMVSSTVAYVDTTDVQIKVYHDASMRKAGFVVMRQRIAEAGFPASFAECGPVGVLVTHIGNPKTANRKQIESLGGTAQAALAKHLGAC